MITCPFITTAPDLREEWMGKGEEIGRFKEREEREVGLWEKYGGLLEVLARWCL
jgi:hypothetical protein